MPNYKKMYLALFNAVTTVIDQLQNAQRRGEDSYLENDDAPLILLSQGADDALGRDK